MHIKALFICKHMGSKIDENITPLCSRMGGERCTQHDLDKNEQVKGTCYTPVFKGDTRGRIKPEATIFIHWMEMQTRSTMLGPLRQSAALEPCGSA